MASPSDTRRGSVMQHLLSASRRQTKARPLHSSINKAMRPSLTSEEEIRQRRVVLSDAQVQAATSVYESHGGLTAHFALMLQRLSLPHDQADELLDAHHVSRAQPQLPIATFLGMVRDVYESVLEEDATQTLRAALTPSEHRGSRAYESGVSLTRAQRWADADADHAYEALHTETSLDELDRQRQQQLQSTSMGSSCLLPPIQTRRAQRLNMNSSSHPEDDGIIDAILSPMKEQSYAELRRAVMPRPENPLQIRAFLRLGAVKNDETFVLDTATLNARCEAIGLTRDEQQAVVNLFDEDCSGEIDFDEFKAIMTGNLAEFGLGDAVVTALQKLMQVSTISKVDLAANATEAGNRQSRRAATLFSRIIASSSPQAKRRQSVLPNNGLRDAADDDDEEDETHLLQQMQTTVDSCRSHSREQSTIIQQRVNQLASDVNAKSPKQSPRHPRNAGDADLATVRPSQLSNSYTMRTKQRKNHFSIEEHRRREEARRQKHNLPPLTSWVKENCMADHATHSAIGDVITTVQPHNIYAGMVPPHFDGPTSPRRDDSPKQQQQPTATGEDTLQAATARTHRAKPPQPPGSRQVPQPATARRDMIGSRQRLYDKILSDKHDYEALMAPLRRTRSPAEVSRMLDAHRAREDRLAVSAANRLGHFREMQGKALELYQEQQAVYILAKHNKSQRDRPHAASESHHEGRTVAADVEPSRPPKDNAE